MDIKQVLIGSININYYYHQTGKPCVLLLHGLTDSGLYWERVANKLVNEFDIIAPDLRGHGYSSKPQAGYTYNDFAGDVSGFIHALKLKNITIVGHSIGADIALLVARQNNELVCGIVLEDPPWEDPYPSVEQKIKAANDLREELQRYANQSLLDLENFFRATTPNADPVDTSNWAQSQKLASPSVAEWETSPPINWRSILPEITYKMLLLTGDPRKGAYVTPSTAEQAKKLWLKGEHREFNDSGHTIHVDQFEQFVDVLLKFLRATYQGGTE